MKLPRIGMRIMKSAIAVFVCLLINQIRGDAGIVFYSCIAAVLCIQSETAKSYRVGINRMIGTFNGGLIGMLVLVLLHGVIGANQHILRNAIIALSIIPVIYTTVVLKQKSASYISCVVFLSIVVSHGRDINPYLFACNRMLDTLIGIVVAWIVNEVHLPIRKKDTLIVIYLDDLIINETLDPYVKAKLNLLLEKDVSMVGFSHKLPHQILSMMQEVPNIKALLLCNGALCYHQDQHFTATSLSHDVYEKLSNILGDFPYFSYVLQDDVLHVYYASLDEGMRSLHNEMRKTMFHACVHATPANQAVFLIVVSNRQDLLKQLTYGEISEQIQVAIVEDMLYITNAMTSYEKQLEKWKHDFKYTNYQTYQSTDGPRKLMQTLYRNMRKR